MAITMDEYLKTSERLLKCFAHQYTKRIGFFGIEYNDLYQVGALALIEKYNEYDETISSIKTFSYMVIKGAILNYISQNSTITNVSKPMLYVISIYKKDTEEFYNTNGRDMTFDEKMLWVDKLNKLPLNDKYELIRWLDTIIAYHYNSTVCSLDDNYEDSVDDNDILTIKDCILDSEGFEDKLISKIFIEEFNESLSSYLTEREKNILTERLGLEDNLPKKYKELASEYSISIQAIDCIYKKALEKVKKIPGLELI